MNPWRVKENKFPKNGSKESKLRYLIQYAILAPSGHNSQPWLFKVEDNKIEVWADYSKRRESTDPDNRELFISLGCAILNLKKALDYFQIKYILELTTKENKVRPVAEFLINWQEKAEIADNMIKIRSIVERRTNRNPYDGRIIEKEKMAEIIRAGQSEGILIKTLDNQADKEMIADLIAESTRIWFKNKKLVDGLREWIRDDGGGEGLSLEALNLDDIAQDLNYFQEEESEAVNKKAERDKNLCIKSSVVLIISSSDTPYYWLKVGMSYQSMALAMTGHGIQNSFFFSVLEIPKQKEKLKKILKLSAEPQLVIRLGYGAKVRHTERRPVDEVLI